MLKVMAPRRRIVLVALASFAALSASVIACSTEHDCPVQPAFNPAVGCDPATNAACVSEREGIFVDGANGSDSNPGTKAEPVKTIRIGMSQAVAFRKSTVFVCSAMYDEKLVIAQSTAIHAGLDCGTWSYSGARAKIAPSAHGGAAVTVRAPSGFVTMTDFDIVASDGVDNAEDDSANSVGLFAAEASLVTLQRVSVVAGKGGKGKDALAPMTNAMGDAASLVGKNGVDAIGGAAKTCPCRLGSSTGGAGASPGQDGGAGSATLVDGGVVVGGAGGVASPMCANGGRGTNGQASVATASVDGTLKPVGWTRGQGRSGGTANAGTGGGGGGAEPGTFAGGAGGCGGCGGSGAHGGLAGGSSFAVLILDATLSAADARFEPSSGGNGGSGADGEAGVGAGGGGGVGGAGGCTGGFGGNGAGGGGGQGGPGGHSVPVAYSTRAPQIDAASVTLTPGAAGIGGAGGKGGLGGSTVSSPMAAPSGADGAAGEPGRAAPTLALQ